MIRNMITFFVDLCCNLDCLSFSLKSPLFEVLIYSMGFEHTLSTDDIHYLAQSIALFLGILDNLVTCSRSTVMRWYRWVISSTRNRELLLAQIMSHENKLLSYVIIHENILQFNFIQHILQTITLFDVNFPKPKLICNSNFTLRM